jgi:glycosyltransferase involved in cell wall biosynthesis
MMMGHGLEWKRTKYSSWQRKFLKFMERVTAGMNTNLLMVSQEQSDWFLSEYNKKNTIIPCAVNLPEDKPNSDILSKYGLKKNRYYLYLGRLVQDKNPDYLIKAFNKAEITDSHLVIAGSNDADIPYVEYLHSLAKDNPKVVFTGAVYGEDKETLLKNAKVFCIPSTIEGLAITLLEAMSYARPVIASDIPSNKEGLVDNGIWVKAEDVDSLVEKLQYCENNIAELQIQALKNRQRIEENFTWDKVAKKYINYLEQFA